MSYILEALKKSEQERERERGALPDIQSVHSPRSSLHAADRNWWPVILVSIVVVAAASLAVVLLTKENSTENSTKNSRTDQARLEQSSPTKAIEKPAVKVPLEKEVKSADLANTSRQKAPTKNSAPGVEHKKQSVVFSKQQLTHDDVDVIGNVEEQRQQVATSKAQSPVKKGRIETDATVTISDIPDGVRKRIPNIAFEGHVYSSIPARRSVMINGQKRREGDSIGDGLLIKEITGEGAEFEFQGYRFRLNALQDWTFK